MRQSTRVYLKAIVNLIIAAITIVLIIYVAPAVISFFMPFIIGWIIALIASPVVKFFESKLKFKRKAGSAIVIIAVIAIIILIFYGVISALIGQIYGLINDMPQLVSSVQSDLQGAGSKLSRYMDGLPKNTQTMLVSVGDQIFDFINGLFKTDGGFNYETISDAAKQVPTIIIAIVMCLLSAYFFTAEKDHISDIFRTHMPEGVLLYWDMIKGSVRNAVGGYFKAQMKIEVVIYIETTIGLMILQVDYGFLFAFLIAFLDFLPVFGAGAVMIPWALVKLFTGDIYMAVGLLITWGIGQLLRQIIQPKIVGDSVGMGSLSTIFWLYVGYMFAGVLGMIIAIPVGIIIQNMYKEGVFDTTVNSIRILTCGVNNFRRLNPEDIPRRKDK